jgi:hypothetical protein
MVSLLDHGLLFVLCLAGKIVDFDEKIINIENIRERNFDALLNNSVFSQGKR